MAVGPAFNPQLRALLDHPWHFPSARGVQLHSNRFRRAHEFRSAQGDECEGRIYRPFTRAGELFQTDPITYSLDREIPIDDDVPIIVNVGSVGQPRDENPQSSFAILIAMKRKWKLSDWITISCGCGQDS